MAKQVKPKKDKTPPMAVADTPEIVMSAPATLPICINCRFLETGTWRGPTCKNPESIYFRHHMADSGTCEKFTEKGRPAPPVEDDGLYDPEPVVSSAASTAEIADAALKKLLAEETEANDVQGT